MQELQITNKLELHNQLSALGYEVGVEVGSYRGYGAESLAKESRLKTIWTIDHWKHPRKSDLSNYEDYISCINRLFKYGQRCIPLRMEAREAANIFADSSLCYVFIDAGIEYEEYLSITESWWPKVKKSGMIAGRLFDWVVDASGQMIQTDSSLEAMTQFSEKINRAPTIINDRPLPLGADADNYKGSRSWFIINE